MARTDPTASDSAPGLVVSAGYALLVFVGGAVLGLVVLPAAGLAVGVFATRSDAEAYFSWATLEGVPYVLGLSILSLLVLPAILARPVGARILLYVLDVLVVWSLAAAIAVWRLG